MTVSEVEQFYIVFIRCCGVEFGIESSAILFRTNIMDKVVCDNSSKKMKLQFADRVRVRVPG